jgi:hypothetical protein
MVTMLLLKTPEITYTELLKALHSLLLDLESFKMPPRELRDSSTSIRKISWLWLFILVKILSLLVKWPAKTRLTGREKTTEEEYWLTLESGKLLIVH